VEDPVGVARVSQAVPVAVDLVGVGDVGAVVEGVDPPIAVAIGLAPREPERRSEQHGEPKRPDARER